MDWKAQSLAITSFVPSLDNVDALQPFLAIVTGSPKQLHAATGSPAGQRASTDFGKDSLVVSSRPGRIDLSIEPREGDPPIINNPVEALDALAGYSKKLIDYAPTHRLAVVANLVHFVPNSDQAVNKFSELTGIKGLSSNATELLFQWNDPTPLTSRINMNRLRRWGTAQFQVLELKISVGQNVSEPLLTREWHAVVKGLDFNTSQSNTILSPDEAEAFITKLITDVRSAMTTEDDQINAPI